MALLGRSVHNTLAGALADCHQDGLQGCVTGDAAGLIHIHLCSADAQCDDDLPPAGCGRALEFHTRRSWEGWGVFGGCAAVGCFLGLLIVQDRKLLHAHHVPECIHGERILCSTSALAHFRRCGVDGESEQRQGAQASTLLTRSPVL